MSLLLFNGAASTHPRPAPEKQAPLPPWDSSSSGGQVHTTPPPEFQPATSPYFMQADFNGVTLPGSWTWNGAPASPGSRITMTSGPYQGLVIPFLVGANSTPPTMLMTPMLPLYPAAVQQAMFLEHCYRGYTDFVYATQVWNDAANGYTSSPAACASWGRVLKSWGFRGVLWNGSTTPPNGDPYFQACLSAGVVDFYIAGKEVDTGSLNSQQYGGVLQTAVANAKGIPVAAHFSANYPDGFPKDTFLAGGSTGPGWADFDGEVHLCWQASQTDDAGTQGARLYYARLRVNLGQVGGDGRPAPNCRVYAFETMATAQLFGQCDEAYGNLRSLELMYCPNGGNPGIGMVHGFGNGARLPDGSAVFVA